MLYVMRGREHRWVLCEQIAIPLLSALKICADENLLRFVENFSSEV